jgi:hypothetical protein
VIEAEIERERNRSSVIHHFALVKSKNMPTYSKRSWETPGLRFETGKRNWKTGKLKDHHYVLWGNSNDYLNMGILEVLTDSGKQVSTIQSVHNKFFDVIKKSEHMNFKKVSKK